MVSRNEPTCVLHAGLENRKEKYMDEESKKPTVITSIPGVIVLPPVEDDTGEPVAHAKESTGSRLAKLELVKKTTAPPTTFRRVEVKPRSNRVTRNDVAEHLFYQSQPGQVGVLNTSETRSVYLEDAAKQSVINDADLEFEENWVPTNHLDRRPAEGDLQGWRNFYYAHTYEVISDRRLAKLMTLPPEARVELVRARREKHQQKLLERARQASKEAATGSLSTHMMTVAGAVALFLGLIVIFSPDRSQASATKPAETAVAAVAPKSEEDLVRERNERYANYCPDEYLLSQKYPGRIEAGDAQGKCNFVFIHPADKLRHEDEESAKFPLPTVEESEVEEPKMAASELAELPKPEVFRGDCEQVGAVSIPTLKSEREAFKDRGVAVWRSLDFKRLMRKSELREFLCDASAQGAEAMMLRRYCGQLARSDEKVFADYLPTTEANLRNLREVKVAGCGD